MAEDESQIHEDWIILTEPEAIMAHMDLVAAGLATQTNMVEGCLTFEGLQRGRDLLMAHSPAERTLIIETIRVVLRVDEEEDGEETEN